MSLSERLEAAAAQRSEAPARQDGSHQTRSHQTRSHEARSHEARSHEARSHEAHPHEARPTQDAAAFIDPVQVIDPGKPAPCPECGGPGFLDLVDVRRRCQHEHCVACRARWRRPI